MAETEADLKADGVLGKYAKIIAHAPVERVLKNVSRVITRESLRALRGGLWALNRVAR
jgi:hypothetical protein